MRLTRLVLPSILLAAGVTALAVSFAAAQAKGPYEFKLDADITAQAAAVSIEPRWRGIAEDRFEYEVYFNANRRGSASEDGVNYDAFRRMENWVVLASLAARENDLEGRKDLQLALQYDRVNFLVDDGRGRYSGYIGPTVDGTGPKFQEVLPDGSRNDVNNIPGWAGITASSLDASRAQQAGMVGATAWFSINDQGRLYDDLLYADYGAPDQRNYLGQLIDPLHVALGLHAEFADKAKLKIGETTEVVRRFPMGVTPGATVMYRFAYKLEKLYGKVEEPTAARFTFSAVPVQKAQTSKVGNMVATYDAPEIKDGTLLFDLVKGVTADVTWKHSLEGTISQTGSKLNSKFSVDTDYRASLRKIPPKKAE